MLELDWSRESLKTPRWERPCVGWACRGDHEDDLSASVGNSRRMVERGFCLNQFVMDPAGADGKGGEELALGRRRRPLKRV